MRLKSPGALQTAVDTFTTLARELRESLDTSRPSLQQGPREAWLKWWARADTELRKLFADDELLVPLARTAAEIRALELVAPAYEGPSLSYIVRERDVWAERFEAASQRMGLLSNFVMRPGRIVVLDTSAFHEFDRFWRADWVTLAQAEPPYAPVAGLPIRLVVPLVVVEELDAQKIHPNGKVRQAARDILKHLRALERVSADPVANVLRLGDRVTVR